MEALSQKAALNFIRSSNLEGEGCALENTHSFLSFQIDHSTIKGVALHISLSKLLNFQLIHQKSRSSTDLGIHQCKPHSSITTDQIDQEKEQCSSTWEAVSNSELQILVKILVTTRRLGMVKDCLDMAKLGYVYQEVDIPWLKSRPTPRVSKLSRKTNKAGVAKAAETQPAFPTKLDKVVRATVQRPKKSRSKKEKEEEEEILVIDGIEVERDQFVKFDVFINDRDEPVIGPENSEFAGSFLNVPHRHKHGKKMKTCLRLGISELLEDLEAEDDESVLVTLVPRKGSDALIIGGLKIEFDS